MTEDERQRLRNIKGFDQLIAFLRDELDWPIEQGYDEDDLTFDWSDDLGLKESERVGIKEIKQLRPLETGQPWGIFFVNFEKQQLPVVILRRILNALVMKKRASANNAQRAAWQQHDLLFISSYGEEDGRQLTFAHFSEPDSELDDTKATLRVLGWDDEDTNLKLDYVADKLKESLTWPRDVSDLPAWRKRWSEAFELRHRQVIDTAEELALRLAELAKRIRNRMLLVLPRESESGDLRKLLKGFKTALIHDLDEAQFADMYAQTITYGLFSAAVSRTVPGAGTAVVQGNVVDMIPVTNPFLKEMLQSFLKAGGRRGKMDFDELGIQEVVDLLNDKKTNLQAVLRDFGNKTRGEDPVIHFYEGFAKKYDPIDKVRRGEFYTPLPVVSYIVRSVHELLQAEFGLADGLADTITWGEMLKKHPHFALPYLTDEPGEDRTISPNEPFVQILDPATGTGTFLVEVIDIIHRTMSDKWKLLGLDDAACRNAWNDYVPKHLLPRLYAYELKMAPYAIAHMKIGLKLIETGYRFDSNERARVFLTNALEPWQRQLQLPEFGALAHEAAAVNEVKRSKRFTVVIGNPPYASLSSNMFPWIRDQTNTYLFLDGKRIEEKSKRNHLQNDYIKFVRIADLACQQSPLAVFAYITSNSYLDGRTLRGMRWNLRHRYHYLSICNLYGDSNKGDAPPGDENVFDITEGVSILLASRSQMATQPRTFYTELQGSRESKYQRLANPQAIPSKELSVNPPHYLFKDVSANTQEEFQKIGPGLDQLYRVSGAGMKSNRDEFATGEDKAALMFRMREFADSSIPNEIIRKKYSLKDNYTWKLPKARIDFKTRAIDDGNVFKLTYRPFDSRYVYYDKAVVFNPRIQIMKHMMDGTSLAIVSIGQNESLTFNHAFVSRNFVEIKAATHYGASIVFPIFIDGERAGIFDGSKESNLTDAAQSLIEIASQVRSPCGSVDIAIAHFVYSILYSGAYRERYAEPLLTDFPRVPSFPSIDLFEKLGQLGSELVALHLLESPRLDQPITEFVGIDHEVSKVGYTDGTVWIDAGGTKNHTQPGTRGFRGVPEDVWNFHMGGYRVCEKWLKDRKGRRLSNEDISHYHKIVVALSETIRLMAEIDSVIDEHGGWPGAFQPKATT